jgi:hypothetical protein
MIRIRWGQRRVRRRELLEALQRLEREVYWERNKHILIALAQYFTGKQKAPAGARASAYSR